MTYQAINLGTPNNNDGDSLYAGGVKINANFVEIYNALAGGVANAIRIGIASGTIGTSTTLSWNSSTQKFEAASSDAIRTLSANGANALYLTDNSGLSGGADSNLSGLTNTLHLVINGRHIWHTRARTTGTTANTRAELHFGMGNSAVSSLSIYTSGVVVRGVNGLEVYRASAEDTASYVTSLTTTTNGGIRLHLTPVLDSSSMSANVLNGSDSSLALCHTGFVKLNLGSYPLSSTAIIGARGIISTGSSLASSMTMSIDGIYHPKHIEGLIYNYSNEAAANKITLVTGAACHWSYNTSGVASVIPTSAIAVVASYTPIIRKFTNGWTPEYLDDGSIPACIDAATNATPLVGNTWYYLYYLGCLAQHTVGSKTFYPGSSNLVVSSNRDIASVNSQIAARGYGNQWAVVRRLGPIRTDAAGTAAVPFNVKRIDHGGFEYYWGLQPNANGDTSYTLTINTAAQMKQYGSADTINLSDYNSAVLTTVPPIPGITAHITVRHLPAGGAQAPLPEIRFYGEAWTVNSSISALYPPFEIVRSMTTGLVNVHNIQLPMSPDGCYIPDGTYNGAGILSVTTSTGQRIRWTMVRPQHEGAKAVITSTLLQFTVTGFRLAR